MRPTKSVENVYQYMKPSIPADHCAQSRATDIVEAYLANKLFNPKTILDLGCGIGDTISYFEKKIPASTWTGIDIESSPEVNARTRSGDQFLTFDGVNIPVASKSIDLIYSNQVLEHVRHPEQLLANVSRVLSKKGYFIGQTSQLEPYHSFSFWNFTFFGFKKICEDAGLVLEEIRPSIDGPTLIDRSYKGRPKEMSRWFGEESPVNQEIEAKALTEKQKIQIINFRKLQFCGQFAFACRRK